MKLNIILLWIIVIALVVAGVYFFNLKSDDQTFQGVTVGNEYTATSTPSDMNLADGLIREGWGTLGSVIITEAGTAEYWLLNATNSLANTDVATSTVLLGIVPASLAAGTYTFDVIYTDGLYLDVITAGTGTSTISHR